MPFPDRIIPRLNLIGNGLAGCRYIHVWKCGRTLGQTDACTPAGFTCTSYKFTLWAFGSGELKSILALLPGSYLSDPCPHRVIMALRWAIVALWATCLQNLCKSKGTDQLFSNIEADQRDCFCSIASVQPTLCRSRSKTSSKFFFRNSETTHCRFPDITNISDFFF